MNALYNQDHFVLYSLASWSIYFTLFGCTFWGPRHFLNNNPAEKSGHSDIVSNYQNKKLRFYTVTRQGDIRRWEVWGKSLHFFYDSFDIWYVIMTDGFNMLPICIKPVTNNNGAVGLMHTHTLKSSIGDYF